MSWNVARGLLNNSVVKQLGEDLTLTQASPGTETAMLRGVLVRPEQAQRFGATQIIAGAATLTIRVSDAPSWFGRGVSIESESGETFKVTAAPDNGEGVIEAVLCRLT